MLPQLLSCAYSYKYLEVLWLPKRTQLWACFNTEPNRLYRRLRLFPSKLQEYTPPSFSRLSTQYHIDPLLACLLSLDTSRTGLRLQRSTNSVTGILRMGDMNIHITWLTHVRTGPKKKNRAPAGRVTRCAEVCVLMRESQTVGACADWETAAVASEEAAMHVWPSLIP